MLKKKITTYSTNACSALLQLLYSQLENENMSALQLIHGEQLLDIKYYGTVFIYKEKQNL